MKQLFTFMALSFLAITVSAQEVTEIKSDTSFLEGRVYLEKMNAKTQDPVQKLNKNKLENTGAKEFALYTERMTLWMKRLNTGQTLPSEENLKEDFADNKAHKSDRDFLRKGRIDMRLMNERTNPNTTSPTRPSSHGSKSTFGIH